MTGVFAALAVLHALGGVITTVCLLTGWRRQGRRSAQGPMPSAGLVIPAWNAGHALLEMGETLAAARALGLPAVVVDDGSCPTQAHALAMVCARHGASLVRHPANLGKVAALHSGLAILHTEVIVTVDADTVLAAPGFHRGIAAFTEPHLGAMAVMLTAAPGGALAGMQAAEYAFMLDFERQALSRLGLVFTVPGAASFWRRAALDGIGGFKDRTMAEDTDATLALQRKGWQVAATRDAMASTQVPASLGALVRQRRRWIWGHVQAARYHATKPGVGMVFACSTLLNLVGHVLALWGPIMLTLGPFPSIAAVAMLVALAAGLIRIAAAMAFRSEMRTTPRFAVFGLLAGVVVMQLVNTVAFWIGLVTLTPWRRRWQ